MRLFKVPVKIHTVKYVNKEPAYVEHSVIRSDIHSPVFTKELVEYTFRRNSGYKELIFFKVRTSSVLANLTVFH